MSAIKNIRKRLLMTQEEFAQSLGVSKMCISNYEKGKYFMSAKPLKKLINLARSRGIDVDINDLIEC